MRWTLVAYDVMDDKRRRHVARWLGGRGYRIQHSVFLLPELGVHAISDGLKPLIEASVDQVLIQPLCKSCLKRASRLGVQPDPTRQVDFYIL